MSSTDISKVYQFLANIGDWKTKADKNGDGTVIKSEFCSFMENNYEWDGTPSDVDKNDLINSFWKAIDTKQGGKLNGTRYYNKNALDSNEEDAINAKVQCYDTLNTFVKDNVKLTDAPSGVSTSQWKASITEGLTTVVEEFLKNKSTDAINKAIASGELTTLLEKQLPISKGRATADYYAMNLTKSYKSQLGNFDVYSDPIFKELLDKYVKSNFPDGASTETMPTDDTIKTNVENMVKAYLATAGVGDGNIKDLEEDPYNWRQGDEDELTALQKNQALQKLNTKIESSYDTLFSEVFAGINVSASDKAALKTQLATTIETEKSAFIDTLNYSDFQNLDTKLEEFDLSSYINTDMKNNVLTSYYTNQASEYISNFDIAGALNDKTLSTELIASIKSLLKNGVSAWVSSFVAAGSKSSEFEAYVNQKITDFLSSGTVSDLIKAEQEKIIAQNNEKMKAAAANLAKASDNVKSNNLADIIGNNSELHTEFGIDKNGNIVFQETSTTNAYKTLVEKVKAEINQTEEGKAALEALGGEDVLKRLVQAAWIDTYNTYNSSQSNNAANFVAQVLDNFQTIMNKLSKNPEYIAAYTAKTSYADSSLTKGLIHYNTNTTYGGDERINYKGTYKTDDNGAVHIENTTDDADYQLTMNDLLRRLKNKYSTISSDVITNVFRSAQQKALSIAQGNITDCPYGTGNNNSRVEDTTRDWGGKDNRKKDKFYIDMDQLVQLTLYCFDKLLYQELGA